MRRWKSAATQAVITRRGLDVKTAEELGRLDQAAIDRVKDEACRMSLG